jgi:hypothetical protein
MASLLKTTVPGLRVRHEREEHVHFTAFLRLHTATMVDEMCVEQWRNETDRTNTREHMLLHFRQIKVAPTSHSRDLKKM